MILHRNFEFANLRFLIKVSNSFNFVFANANLERRRVYYFYRMSICPCYFFANNIFQSFFTLRICFDICD